MKFSQNSKESDMRQSRNRHPERINICWPHRVNESEVCSHFYENTLREHFFLDYNKDDTLNQHFTKITSKMSLIRTLFEKMYVFNVSS